jgi:hypothetical protein
MTELELADIALKLHKGLTSITFASGPLSFSAEEFKVMLTNPDQSLSDNDINKILINLLNYGYVKEHIPGLYHAPSSPIFSNLGTGDNPWIGWT